MKFIDVKIVARESVFVGAVPGACSLNAYSTAATGGGQNIGMTGILIESWELPNIF